jgi:hypothetical protein
MRDPQWERKEVPVRYDHEDIGVAYARIGGQWLRCISCHYDALKGKSEKQLRLAVATLRQRRSLIEGNRTVTARQIARFFESVEGEEVLREQRLKDMARQRIVEETNLAPAVADAPTVQGGSPTPVEPAEDLSPAAHNVPTLAKGPVFEDF